MKIKPLFMAGLLISSFICQGQIKFNGYLTTGYENRFICGSAITLNETPTMPIISVMHMKKLRNSYFALVDITGSYKGFEAYTSNKTYFKPLGMFKYNPLQIEYMIGIRWKFKSIQLNYEHMCSHSIDEFTFNDAYDRLAIKLKLF